MKKGMIVYTAAVLALSMSEATGISAAAAESSPTAVEASALQDAAVTVTFTPDIHAGSGGMHTMDQSETYRGLGGRFPMSGSSWRILQGSNVVSLSGSYAVMIGYGTAKVQAYKANGHPLGVYTFTVIPG
ncbi:hypothetical protein [Paenibacillus wulumuqiensis]|uniref:hypothetical protein n=1 Tax=Paenibacillus wulumuqiensis TaxID=1567107 RepID=UPI000619A95A|nr:hypothetical protein [Paenibacillus wulumuqiensis]